MAFVSSDKNSDDKIFDDKYSDKYKLMDGVSKRQITQSRYERCSIRNITVMQFSDGLAFACRNNKFGLMDKMVKRLFRSIINLVGTMMIFGEMEIC